MRWVIRIKSAAECGADMWLRSLNPGAVERVGLITMAADVANALRYESAAEAALDVGCVMATRDGTEHKPLGEYETLIEACGCEDDTVPGV